MMIAKIIKAKIMAHKLKILPMLKRSGLTSKEFNAIINSSDKNINLKDALVLTYCINGLLIKRVVVWLGGNLHMRNRKILCVTKKIISF